jgi:hypothetical protein
MEEKSLVGLTLGHVCSHVKQISQITGLAEAKPPTQ